MTFSRHTLILRPGIVWYLDTTILNHSAATLEIPESHPPDGESRPFVCLIAKRGQSTWAEITTQPREWRLALHHEWLVSRGGSFLQGGMKSWLNGTIYAGEDEAFRDAAVEGSGNNRFSASSVELMLAHLLSRRETR